MMKTVFKLPVLCLIILASCSTGRKITVAFPEPIIRIYEVRGTKNELFIKSNIWMFSAFEDAKNVIQYADKSEGIIIGKYVLVPHIYTYTLDNKSIYAFIEIRVVDGKAYISVDPGIWTYTQTRKQNDIIVLREGEYTKEKVIADIDALFDSFYQSLKTAYAGKTSYTDYLLPE